MTSFPDTNSGKESKWVDVPLEVSVLRHSSGQIVYDDKLNDVNSGQALEKLINLKGAKLAVYRLYKVVEAE